MKKTLCRCIIFIHENWKKDIRLYVENDNLYIRLYEKNNEKQTKTTVEFGNVEPDNVYKAYEKIKKLIN